MLRAVESTPATKLSLVVQNRQRMNYTNWKIKMKPISKTFFNGLIALIPLILTLYLLFWLADTAELVLGNIFKFLFPDSWYIRGLGFVLGLVVAYFF
jgi:hypothetical protein